MRVCTAVIGTAPNYEVRRVYKHGRIYIYVYRKGLLIASILVYVKG